MTALLDTGFLLAVIDDQAPYHTACANALLAKHKPLFPDVVLPELAYLVLKHLGPKPLATFLAALQLGELPIEHFRAIDLQRAREVLLQYADNRVDFVDCVIVAMAERLKIQRICTIDQRHFRIFRPTPCDHFDIVPVSN